MTEMLARSNDRSSGSVGASALPYRFRCFAIRLILSKAKLARACARIAEEILRSGERGYEFKLRCALKANVANQILGIEPRPLVAIV